MRPGSGAADDPVERRRRCGLSPGRSTLRIDVELDQRVDRRPALPSARRRLRRAPALIPLFRRAQWVLLDQVLSSASNFLFAILVARSVPAREFGLFTVAFLIYQVTLNTSRSLVSDPLVIGFSAEDPRAVLRRGRASTGTAMTLGAVGGALMLATTTVGPGVAGAATVPLAFALPGLFLQDAWRYVFFASRAPAKAAFNDSLWLLAQLGLFAALAAVDRLDVTSLTAAWGGAATVAGVVGCVQAGVPPSPAHARSWLRQHRRVGMGLTTDALVRGAAAQLGMLSIGAAAGLTAVGAVRAALLLFGPPYILLQGGVALAVPEAVRLRQRHPDRLLSVAIVSGLLLGLVPALWGAGLLAMPERFGDLLLGDSWPTARALVPTMTVMVIAAAVLVPAAVGLRALVSVRRLVITSLVVAPLGVLFAAAGALAGETRGAAHGLAAGHWLMGVVLWWQFVAAVRSADTAPESPRRSGDR